MRLCLQKCTIDAEAHYRYRQSQILAEADDQQSAGNAMRVQSDVQGELEIEDNVRA